MAVFPILLRGSKETIMFVLCQSKGELMKVTDIHCHLIPYVDDGASSFEEMKRLLQMENHDGVQRIILTPHFRPELFETSPKKIRSYYELTKKAAKEVGIRTYLGCEFYRYSDLLEDLKGKKVRTMHGSKYVLIEFAPQDLFQTIRNFLYELLANGYTPILAHVERYMECRDMGQVRELSDMGVWIQVNAGALLGKQGIRIKQYCWKLIEEDLVDFIASDAHDLKHRKPNLGKIIRKLERKKGKAYVRRIFEENPGKILKKLDNRRNADETNQHNEA